MAAIQVIERPILFSGAMVRGILEGRKTQTRRVVKFPATFKDKSGTYRIPPDLWEPTTIGGAGTFRFVRGTRVAVPEEPAMWSPRGALCITSPYGKPGDRLWVRETLTKCVRANGPFINYAADDKCVFRYGLDVPWPKTWKQNPRPSIHMPRWASRLTLEIVSVKVERVQEISGFDCLAEGIPEQGGNSSDGEWRLREAYRTLWDSINAKRTIKTPDGEMDIPFASWDKNPWVWCLTFKKVSSPSAG